MANTQVSADEIDYYRTPGGTSELSRHRAVVPLVRTPNEAGDIARNCVLHIAAVSRLGLDLPASRFEDVNVRSAARIVDRVLDLPDEHTRDPLDVEREPERRMIGNCHHVALLTCALLRANGFAARTRVGFSTHLEPGRFIDHWVCEVIVDGSWTRFDPDAGFGVGHPQANDFLSGEQAWSLCRAGDADPALFGIDDEGGWWFIGANVIRDVAALCKVELLPWDRWGAMPTPFRPVDFDRIDRAAALCHAGTTFTERREAFSIDHDINPGNRAFVFKDGALQEVALPDVW